MRKRAVMLGLLALLLALALQSWPGNSHPSVAHAAGTYTSAGVSPTNHPWLGYGLNEYPVMRNSSDADAAWTSANLNLTTWTPLPTSSSPPVATGNGGAWYCTT